MIKLQQNPLPLSQQRAVFFDRDGVINHLIEVNGQLTSPKNIEQFKFLPKVFESIDLIQKQGFMTFIVTNQPGVSDRTQTWEELNELTNYLLETLMVDGVYNAVDKNSDTYKPGNGMIEYFINRYNLNRSESYIIGDRWKDIVPGYQSEINTIFVGEDYQPPEEYRHIKPNVVLADIYDACNYILEENDEGI